MLAIDRNPLQTVFGQNEPAQDFLRVANIFEPRLNARWNVGCCRMLRDLAQSLKFDIAQFWGQDLIHPTNVRLRRLGSSRVGRFFSAPSFLWNGQAADLAGDLNDGTG